MSSFLNELIIQRQACVKRKEVLIKDIEELDQDIIDLTFAIEAIEKERYK